MFSYNAIESSDFAKVPLDPRKSKVAAAYNRIAARLLSKTEKLGELTSD